jgi:hypothetical protein
MKSFNVSAFFPELASPHAWQACVSKASEMSTALSRGLSELRQRPAVKGRHVTEVRITIREITPRSPVAAKEQ